jgi:hypothetical protein
MDISSRELTTVSPDEPIGTAVRLMAVQVARGVPGHEVRQERHADQVTADRAVAEGSLEISNEEDRDANQ